MTRGPAGGGLDATGRRRVLATLCLTQVIGWGVLFYAFPVLQGSISTETGWPATWVAGAFTGGQVVAALGGVAVGRMLDRHGPRALMTLGSIAAVVALQLVGVADSATGFAAAWLLAGVAMSAALYGPAFAAITGWYDGPERLRALTVLTVAGGLASTVFAPLTAWLHRGLDWRHTYLVLGAGLAVTIPAHWWGLRGPWPGAVRPAGTLDAAPRSILFSRSFLALVAALAITALCSTAVVVNLVPLLREHGLDLQTASVLLALGGLGQVAGRIGYGPLAVRLTPVGQGVVVLGVLGATTALLGVVASLHALVIVVLVAGTARGCLTLLRATAVADRWGTGRYAQMTGVLSLPVALAGAAAPWAGAQLAAWMGSLASAFLALAGLNAAATALVLLTAPAPAPDRANAAGVSESAGARR